jgi:hypothetical protein
MRFVAVPRESQPHYIHLCMTKERLHKISLRTLRSLRGIYHVVPPPPLAASRRFASHGPDGRQRRIRKRRVATQRKPLYFQFSWQPRRGCTRRVSPRARVWCVCAQLWGESARGAGLLVTRTRASGMFMRRRVLCRLERVNK